MSPRRRAKRPGRRAPVLVATAALALAMLASSCTTGGGPSTGPKPSASSADASTASPRTPSTSPVPVTLRFAVYGGHADVRAYRALARSYTRAHPEVTVRVEASGTEEAAERRLARQFAAGDPPDVFLADSSSLPTLVGEGRVQPVDRLLEQRNVQFGELYERLGLEAFAADSSLQCMPNNVSPQVVFYNKRLLTPAAVVVPGVDPPSPQTGWNWAQFETAARNISTIGIAGVYLPPSLRTLAPLLRGSGGDIVDDLQHPTTLTLSDPGQREAMETILGLARDRLVNLGPVAARREGVVSRFEHGRLGMLIGTRALVPRLRHQPGLRFDVYPLPRLGSFRTTAEVTGYCISKASEHVDAAADLIAYASSDAGAKITARSGGIVPANLAALQSKAFEDPHQLPRHVEVFTTVIRRAETMPDAAGWADVVTRTEPLLRRLFYAPRINLDRLLRRIDRVSRGLLAEPTPSPTPSAAGSPTPTS